MTKGNIKATFSLLILVFINFIFTYKYLERYTGKGLMIAGMLITVQLLVFKYEDHLKISTKWLKIFTFFFGMGIIGLIIISHLKIDLASLKVDRWSVISSFLQEAFDGNYPYFAKSHQGNPPGPMPIYFLIALPFHVLGELSILSAVGYFVLLFMLYKHVEHRQGSFPLLVLLATSFYLYWEIATRSNIVTYSVLILLVLDYFLQITDKTKRWKFVTAAVLTGLLLSTRSVFVLVYIVFFLSVLLRKEMKFQRLVIFLSIAVIVFAGTFLPFILFFKEDFFKLNPFIIQSSYLVPTVYTILFMIIAAGLSFFVKNNKDKFFFSGLSLFISIFIYAVYLIGVYGFENAYTHSKIDVSYFLFCVPFFYFYLMRPAKGRHHSPVTTKRSL